MKKRSICRKPVHLVELVRKAPFKKFDKGEILLNEGDEPTKLFAIKQGFVKVTALSPSGSEQLIWLAGSQDMVPVESLFSARQTGVQFFYTAYTDLVAYEVDRMGFLESVRSNFELMHEVALVLGGYHDRLLRRVYAAGQAAARRKIIHTLYDLATQLESGKSSVDLYNYGLRLTHQDIADMIGATRETVSVEMHRLRLRRLVSYNRRKFVIHTKRLLPLIESEI